METDAHWGDTTVLSHACHIARKPHACEGCTCRRNGILEGDCYHQVVLVGGDPGFRVVRRCVVPKGMAMTAQQLSFPFPEPLPPDPHTPC